MKTPRSSNIDNHQRVSQAFNDLELVLISMSDVHCTNCNWFGSVDETNLEREDHHCPRCNDRYDNGTLYNTPRQRAYLTKTEIAEFMSDLVNLCVEFNRMFGYSSWAKDNNRPFGNRYNAQFELDIHGFLVFRVLDWNLFHEVPKQDYWKCEGNRIEVNRPELFDVSEFRDRFWTFHKIFKTTTAKS